VLGLAGGGGEEERAKPDPGGWVGKTADRSFWGSGVLGSRAEESAISRAEKGGKGGVGIATGGVGEADAGITLGGGPAGEGVMGDSGRGWTVRHLVSCVEMIDGEKARKMHVTVMKGKRLSEWTEG